ncbi:MAG: DNA adenine methylase [Prevotella sp.]|nr:DNA adenine methylase [Prevotella sp.]
MLEEQRNIETGLSPIIKWPGGKEKEMKYILPNVPRFERFIEPFVGGGAVFMGMAGDAYYINDYSSELMDLYQSIATSDADFFRYAEMMDVSWQNSEDFYKSSSQLVDTYVDYRNELVGKDGLKEQVHAFCMGNQQAILDIIGEEFASLPCVLVKEMETNLFRKMLRMRELEKEKHVLPVEDVNDNMETAIKSAVYMNYRHLYNSREIAENNPQLHGALFLFIRNYAFSGMFRYNAKGAFNVPYGGMAYNRKMLNKKLCYYKSSEVLNHFKKTKTYNLDFEHFLRLVNPQENDFVFLDPPYDSEFSTYAQNAFTREDQRRLADYLIGECRAKWMLVIKNTDFIYGLYDRHGIHIRTFDKEYVVSFMNRNDKKVTHLLITNY